MKLLNFPEGANNADGVKEAAVGLHAMYKAYVDAGFTRQQAMDILQTMLRASLSQQPTGPNKGA